jgi:hypothetical protein
MPMLSLTANRSFCCNQGNVPLSGWHMTEKKLDLVQFAAGEMAKTRACPPWVVGCQLVSSCGLGRSLDDLPKNLGRHALAPDRS